MKSEDVVLDIENFIKEEYSNLGLGFIVVVCEPVEGGITFFTRKNVPDNILSLFLEQNQKFLKEQEDELSQSKREHPHRRRTTCRSR